jgi:hypothetical protein
MASAKTFTGFKIQNEVLEKAKYIAWFERKTLTSKVEEFLENDISKFEKKNGLIAKDQLKQIK